MDVTVAAGTIMMKMTDEMFCKRHLTFVAHVDQMNISQFATRIVHHVLTKDFRFGESLRLSMEMNPNKPEMETVNDELKACSPLCCRVGDTNLGTMALTGFTKRRTS